MQDLYQSNVTLECKPKYFFRHWTFEVKSTYIHVLQVYIGPVKLDLYIRFKAASCEELNLIVE